MKYQTLDHKNAGLGVIEIIVAIAIIITTLAGIVQLISLESRVQSLAREEAKAYLLARETIEATRFVRDKDWSAFAALSLDTDYYPEISGGEWTLSLVDPGDIDGFTRKVLLHEVFRDTDDSIATAGTLDSDTRSVEAIVEWSCKGEACSATLETYFTNWQSF